MNRAEKVKETEQALADCLAMVERAEKRANAKHQCQMVYSDQTQCQGKTVSWCGDCGSEICGLHAVICCTNIRCEPCQGIHLAHHEWLKRQPEFMPEFSTCMACIPTNSIGTEGSPCGKPSVGSTEMCDQHLAESGI